MLILEITAGAVIVVAIVLLLLGIMVDWQEQPTKREARAREARARMQPRTWESDYDPYDYPGDK